MACFGPDVLVALLQLFMLFTLVARTSRAEVDEHTEFTYSRNHKTGPTNWAKLHPDWTACGAKVQSPIDLVDNEVVVLPGTGNLVRHYKPAPAVVKNHGHHISVEWTGDAGGMIINGTMYKLQDCHWHNPSEHAVNAIRYDMEVHLVHKDALGQIAVVGIMYKLGSPDPFLEYLLQIVRRNGTMTIRGANQNGTLHGAGVERNGITLGIVNPLNIGFTEEYLTYTGSLTTPPCTEGVLWTVLKTVKTVSPSQIQELRNTVADGFEENARPIQLYPDTVYMYSPGMTTP